jgi:hypothetical protein
MKKALSRGLILAIVFGVAGCGPSDKVIEESRSGPCNGVGLTLRVTSQITRLVVEDAQDGDYPTAVGRLQFVADSAQTFRDGTLGHPEDTDFRLAIKDFASALDAFRPTLITQNLPTGTDWTDPEAVSDFNATVKKQYQERTLKAMEGLVSAGSKMTDYC